jgi:hypothetical protein
MKKTNSKHEDEVRRVLNAAIRLGSAHFRRREAEAFVRSFHKLAADKGHPDLDIQLNENV